jgi:3-phenylpropionate/trans-cinnamate dioxygenase ferredoxin reductase subunit
VNDVSRPGSVVILGGGLAGGKVAVTLREEGFPGRVVLIGREPMPPFGRPPLSKTYLRAEEDLDGWYVKPAEWYERNDVQRIAGVGESIDTDERRVLLDGGDSIAYDRLALCTGGFPRRPRIPGIDLPGVQVLRTVESCDALRSVALPGARAVVVGMGFIGAEVAASLRQLGVTVTAVHPGASPLSAVLGPDVGDVLAGIHREHGVELISNDRVVRFDGDGHVERALTEGGVTIECDFAVVGAGIEPDVSAVSGTGIVVENGILVDARCRTGIDGIYAAGDVANHLHPLFGRVRVEHYNNAEKMGGAVARSMLGDDAPYAYVHTFWSDQYAHNLEYVGHATSWDTFVVRGSLEDRRFLGFYIAGGRLRAAVGLNRGGDPELEDDSELRACQRLIAEGGTVKPELLPDESVDLGSLAP